MKINNFTELDKVLQKSFSAIRKDIDKIKKNTESRVEDIKKVSVHDKVIWDTKIKFLTNEIRKLKDNHTELVSLQKSQIDKLDAVNSKNSGELKHHITQELSKVEIETDRLKSDIVKLVAMLKDKMVTRKLFDERNKVYEKNVKELMDLTRDLKDFKGTAQIDRQLNTTREDIDVLKEEITSVNEELGDFRATIQETKGWRDELSNYVQKEEFSQRLALFDKISMSVEKVDQTVSELAELKGQMQTAAGIKEDFNALRTELESELMSLKEGMLAKNDLEELRAKVDTLQSLISKVDSVEEIAKKTGKTEQEIEELRDELLALPELTKELDKLKKENERLMLKVDTQQVKVDLLEATTPKRKEEKKEEKQEAKPEEFIEQTQDGSEIVEQPSEHGFFSKTLKNVADFFIEEEEPLQQETETIQSIQSQPEEPKLEAKEEKKDNEQFIKNIEKIFDEEEAYKFDIDVHSELETKSPGIFSRLKTGIVNFLFEEVGEGDVLEQQQPEMTQGNGNAVAKLPQSIVIETEHSAKTEAKKETKQKKAKKVHKVKREAPKKEVKEESTEEPHYMLNKKPRIFNEGADELETEENNGKKRKYKKVKEEKNPLAEFGEEESLYPEDYFY